MIDLERAGADLRAHTNVPLTPMTEVTRRARRRRNRRHVARGASAAITVLLLAVLAVQWRSNDAQDVVVGPAARSVLRLPRRGATETATLRDGTPVFVRHQQNGEVTVVSAISPHRPYGLQYLVGWCESSQWFEEPAHGSNFDEYGVKRGGPAPTGLVTFAVRTDRDPHYLVIGDSREPAPPATPSRQEHAAGPHCSNSAAQQQPNTRFLMPTLPDTAMAPHKAERIADESLHLVEGVFVTTPERTLGACALGSSGGCANPTQVHLADAELVNDNGTTLYQYLTGRPFQILARAEGGGLSDIVIVGLGNQTDGTCIETYGYSPTATCSLQTPR